MKRLFSRQQGYTTVFHDDPENPDGFILEKVWDSEPLLEQNAVEKRETSGDKWGEMRKVASIPLPLYFLWKSVFKGDQDGFERHVKKFLNDSENNKYRTFEGRL